jgi:hypothetical protein
MSLHVDVFIPTVSARYETYDTMLAGTSVCTVTTTTLQVCHYALQLSDSGSSRVARTILAVLGSGFMHLC